MATVATDHHQRMVEKHREKLRQMELEKLVEYRSRADEISRQSITIEANANDEGHLYGSVGATRHRRRPEGRGHHGCRKTRFACRDRSRNSACTPSKSTCTAEVDAELKVWVVPTVSADDSAVSR